MNQNNDSNRGGQPPRQPNRQSFWLYAGIVLLIMMLFNAFLMPRLNSSRVTEVTYDTFVQMVEEGKVDWKSLLTQFYGGFEKELKQAEQDLDGERIKVPDEETDEVCELCGRKMVIKSGRYGKFLACPGFPECKNTKRLVKDTGGLCPKCGSRMLVRHSKKGRVYYGCEKNPTCDFMTWNEPTTEKCPECGSTLFKKGGKNGILLCEKEGCGYSRALGAEKKE